MVLYRTVIQPLDPSVVTSIDALTFWIDTNSLSSFPNLLHVWNIICSLGFDVTDLHSFEEEFFKSHICVSPKDFQLGIETIRLYRHSWRDRSTESQGVWTIPSEVKVRIDQVSDIMKARKRDFGDQYSSICKARKRISLIRHQLRVVTSLAEQGVLEWAQLSSIKLKASQLSLGLDPEKMPKDISFVRNKLNHQLSLAESEILALSNEASSS